MRITLNLVGVVLMLMGGIWFLQGINLLPGSFMTGQIQWAAARRVGELVGVHVIARPADGLDKIFPIG